MHSSKNIITAGKKMGQGRSKFYKHWSLRTGVDVAKRQFTAQIKRNWNNAYEVIVYQKDLENTYQYAYTQIMSTEDQAITQANLIDWGWADCEETMKHWDEQLYQEQQDFGTTTSWKEEFESRYKSTQDSASQKNTVK